MFGHDIFIMDFPLPIIKVQVQILKSKYGH